MGDKYGRKPLYASGAIANAILYTALMVTDSLIATICLSGAFGMLSSIRVNIGFVYLMELVPKSYKAGMGSFWSVTEGSIYVLATLTFWLLTKDWHWFVSIGYSLSVISACTAWLIPDSPYYLVERQDLTELK